ncbi:MAG: hypothetical protein M1835_002018 [Candelina submexicana]|nr:MAG: hypothetical protein M1835_002018 [Candelina submexicana]
MDHAVPSSETINRSPEVYSSEQFTLIVGTNSNPQFIHKKSHDKLIMLPDDDALVFARILSYLYTHAYEPSPTAKVDFDNFSLDLADAYIMADKYQINLLKAHLVSQFALLEIDSLTGGCPPSSFAAALLLASRRIYTNVAESDTEFRNFFQRSRPRLPLLDEERRCQ